MSESFSRSLLKPGGGLTASGISRTSSKGHSGFKSVELKREDLEDSRRMEALPVFIQWKEYIRRRREAWETLADDFSALQQRYERLQREQVLLQRKERLGELFLGWERAVLSARPQDWRHTVKVQCWTVLRHWHLFASHRKRLGGVYENVAKQCASRAKKRVWKAYRNRAKQNQGLRRYIRHYQLSTLSRWAFGRLQDQQLSANRQRSGLNRLQWGVRIRLAEKVLQAWKRAHETKQRGAQVILRLADRSDHRKLAASLQTWHRPYYQTTHLQRILTSLRRLTLTDSLHTLHRNCLRAAVAFLREELRELPSQLETDLYASCEERIQQLKADLEHDKSLFQQERESLLARQLRLQSAVTSQASRLYQDLSLPQSESA